MLQNNNYVLKGLISALLHLSPNNINSIKINNPIELGSSVDDKTFFLDVILIMNNQTIINLEMQVINEHNWPERSLSYLCRSFDHLNAGEAYQNVKPVIQIGLLDFTLFPDHPEFYAAYKFINVKNNSIYSDKMQLYVLDLTCIHLASEEDKLYQIDHWASLFKTTTWEEIKLLAQKNEFIQSASETIHSLSQTENIRLQCLAREDYYRRQKSMQLMMEQQDAEIRQRAVELEKQKIKLETQSSEIERQSFEIERQSSEIERQSSEIKKQAAIIEQKDSAYNDLLSWAKAHGYKN